MLPRFAIGLFQNVAQPFVDRVAGWRQKEKPLLYNVFHIGDQIIRVGHCSVASSNDVNRLIKCETSGQVFWFVRELWPLIVNIVFFVTITD